MVWENAAIDNTVKGQCIYHFRNSRMIKYWKFYFIKIHYGFLFKNYGDDFLKLINLCCNCKVLAVINMIFNAPYTLLASWETHMQVKKQHLKPDMEQWIGSKLGKKYIKAVNCHSAYLTYMQSTSFKMLGWMTHKL